MKRGRGLQLFRDLHTPLVHLVGDHLKGRVETRADRFSRNRESDHVWISMDPGLSVRVMVSVNTFSIRNAAAGFDPRVRLGLMRGTWDRLPERGINECHRFSYEEIPGIDAVDFLPMERVFLESMILDRVHQAILLEAWGTPYHREISGIHQIHSRRGSCAVSESIEGRDGALRFYFREEQRMETLLFKFCGQ
jgi:hypothetical protein